MDARKVVPILSVSDLAAGFAWFARLSWSTWSDGPGTNPDFGGVCSGDCEIVLCRDGQASRGRGADISTAGPGGDQRADTGV